MAAFKKKFCEMKLKRKWRLNSIAKTKLAHVEAYQQQNKIVFIIIIIKNNITLITSSHQTGLHGRTEVTEFMQVQLFEIRILWEHVKFCLAANLVLTTL